MSDITCPNCGAHFVVADEHLPLRCPGCHSLLTRWGDGTFVVTLTVEEIEGGVRK